MTKSCCVCGEVVRVRGNWNMWRVAVCKGKCARVRKSNLQREGRSSMPQCVGGVSHTGASLVSVFGGAS
jgi:hypothetical protein